MADDTLGTLNMQNIVVFCKNCLNFMIAEKYTASTASPAMANNPTVSPCQLILSRRPMIIIGHQKGNVGVNKVGCFKAD